MQAVMLVGIKSRQFTCKLTTLFDFTVLVGVFRDIQGQLK